MSEKLIKAGAVVLNNNKDKILLIYRSKQDNWSFPKGHIEKNEKAVDTMFREVKEETGLSVVLHKELPPHFYNSLREGEILVKMFLVISENDSELKIEYEKDILEWVSFDKVIEKLKHQNLIDYFNIVLPLLKIDK